MIYTKLLHKLVG